MKITILGDITVLLFFSGSKPQKGSKTHHFLLIRTSDDIHTKFDYYIEYVKNDDCVKMALFELLNNANDSNQTLIEFCYQYSLDIKKGKVLYNKSKKIYQKLLDIGIDYCKINQLLCNLNKEFYVKECII